MLRVIVINVIFSLAGLLIAIAITEVAIDRRFDIPTTTGPILDSPLPDLHDPRSPGTSHVTFENGRERTDIFDQLGGRARSSQMDYGKAHTIAMVGDSFCYGSENDYDDTLQAMLDRRFGERANIVNFGMPGSSSIYYPHTVLAFRQRFPRPLDVLLVSLYVDMQVGDVPRVLQFYRSLGTSTFRGVPMSTARAQRIASSTLARVLFEIELFLRRHSSTYNLLLPPQPGTVYWISLRKTLTRPMFPELEGQLLANLKALATVADVPPERTVVWFVASNHEAEALRQHPSQKGSKRPDFFRLSEQFWDETAVRLRGLGYTVVDPRPEIASALVDQGIAVYTQSGHYTRAAYEITMSAVAPAIDAVMQEIEAPTTKATTFATSSPTAN
jgi:hypothetical protein